MLYAPLPNPGLPPFWSHSSLLSHTLLTVLLLNGLPSYLLAYLCLDPQPNFLGSYPLDSFWARGFSLVFWGEHGLKGGRSSCYPLTTCQLRSQPPHYTPTLWLVAVLPLRLGRSYWPPWRQQRLLTETHISDKGSISPSFTSQKLLAVRERCLIYLRN